MTRRIRISIGCLIMLALLAMLLRYDLALHFWAQAREELRKGHFLSALELLHRAEKWIVPPKAVSFDAGVALYRLERFEEARKRFADAAASAADGQAKGTALYNKGNCDYQLATKLVVKDQQGGRRLYAEAEAAYREAAALAPGLGDARHNLAVVRKRLARITSAAEKAGETPRPERERKGSDATGRGGATGKRKTGEGETEKVDPAERGAATYGKKAEGQSRGRGKRSRNLTPQQAEQMLSEARGREGMQGVVAGKGGGLSRPTEKDW
ncbi:hypothetical protein LPW11_16835 [Geomonas sp. RF6]|uniref:hypothetical protein n=1 Tax=Geomonas sp. RF6 TaxID=2897342 RepID=UPI001E61C2AB|nr:hypothetical protein [Geomonas sp. RF6]UFS69553.1 hypothetical protein LPW11_16835 [Geomonas sp. RF6]